MNVGLSAQVKDSGPAARASHVEKFWLANSTVSGDG